MNNTPAAQPDDWLDELVTRLVTKVAKENAERQGIEPTEIVVRIEDIDTAVEAILQHEAAAVAKARIKSRENLLSKLERTYTRIIGPVKDSPMILTEEAKNYNKFVDDLRLFIDIERKRNNRIAELQRHAQEGGAGE